MSVWNLEAERYQMQFYGSKCSKNDDQIIMWGTFEFLLQIDKKVYTLQSTSTTFDKYGSHSLEISWFVCHSEFYVKSFLEKLEVLNLQFFSGLEALNFVDFVNSSLQKVTKFLKFKMQRL